MKKLFTFLLPLTTWAGTLFAESGTEGALSGLFTINADEEQVVFSKGNLQATTTDLGANWTWAFANNQWDYVGKAVANTTIGSGSTVTENGTVDLFCWSTGATYYGINKSTHGSDFGGNFKDWGDVIGNGWSTLSKAEWLYLFNTRTGDEASTVAGTADVRFVKATVHNVTGVILFPDGGTFAASEFTAVASLNEATAAYDVTTCTDAQWTALETKGCVFLPAAGDRSGTSVYAVNSYGYYWSSTKYGTASAYFLKFTAENLDKGWSDSYYGCSVRLIYAIPSGIIANGVCGKDGDNLTWELTAKGVLTISGTGEMKDYYGAESSYAPWYEQRSSIKSIVIDAGVTSIGDEAFRQCNNLTAVTIPSTVTRIGDAAFFDCKNLPSVTIPQSVTQIGNTVFVGCNGLAAINVDSNNNNYSSSDGVLFDKAQKTLMRFPAGKNGTYKYTIPSTVDSIGEYAFQNCTGMISVTIPKSLKSIGWNGFDNCSGLTSITSNAVTPPSCGDGEDRFDKVDKDIPVNVPDGAVAAYKAAPGWSDFTNIRYHCISASGYCGASGNYTNVTWELSCDGVLTIAGTGDMGDYRSDEHTNPVPWAINSIKAVVIKSGVTNIGRCAFYGGDYIASVDIPNTVVTIKEKAFTHCPALTDINVAADNPNFCSVDGVLFNKDQTTLVQYALGNTRTEFTVPNTVTAIGDRAFEGSVYLTAVTLPKTVNTIGASAFAECHYLTSFEVPKGVTSISDHAFEYCIAMTGITLPNGITKIGASAFYGCTVLEDITLPNSVTSIGETAFWCCRGLKAINIPKGVSTIGKEAFSTCSSLATITCKAINPPTCGTDVFSRVNCGAVSLYVPYESFDTYSNTEPWNSFSIQRLPATSGTCGNDLTWNLDDDGVLTISGTGAMADYTDASPAPWAPYITSIKSIVIGNGVTSIGNYAFAGCSNLPTIILPASITKLGDYAFYGCTGLLSIICDALQPPTCGEKCFDGVDKSSASVYVEDEAMNAYNKANGWKDFDLTPYSQCSLGSGTFGEKDKFTWRLTCGGTLFIEGKGVTAHWSNDTPWKDYTSDVKSVVFSEGITSIGGDGGYDIFGHLENLESISLPNSLTEINNHFNSCTKLTTLVIPNKVTMVDFSFNNCSGLQTIIFGYSVKRIYDSFMGSLTKHPEIICFAVTPPGNLQNSFKDDTHYGATLYVPDESVVKYEDAHPWSEFYLLPLSERPNTRIIASGTAGTGITWELDSNGVLTIRGKGAMANWGKPNPAGAGKRNMPAEDTAAPWYPYHSEILYVVIEEGVETIGDNAFYGCADIQSITCYAEVPPTCGTDVFEGVETSIPLYVLENSMAAYQTASQWQAFTDVEPITQQPTAIESQFTNHNSQITTKILRDGQLFILRDGKTFTLQGQEVR